MQNHRLFNQNNRYPFLDRILKKNKRYPKFSGFRISHENKRYPLINPLRSGGSNLSHEDVGFLLTLVGCNFVTTRPFVKSRHANHIYALQFVRIGDLLLWFQKINLNRRPLGFSKMYFLQIISKIFFNHNFQKHEN